MDAHVGERAMASAWQTNAMGARCFVVVGLVAATTKRQCQLCMSTPPILFRDARFVVLDKPPGLPVHPGPRGGASVEDAFPALSRRKDGPWLVHRLDADTSGCLVVALRRSALLAAQAEFSAGRARKTYWAIVRGNPPGNAGTIDAPLRRHSTPAGWRMVSEPAGQRAVTDWRVRGRAGDVAWLELHPRTGRTHQVRVHCALLGCPVLGDPVYGGVPGRLHLLARAIELALDPPLAAAAEPPAHMRDALVRCGWEGDATPRSR
jgi:tRNA pseudouridine32 synthase/23S rRNA pseudouridine746 synthase